MGHHFSTDLARSHSQQDLTDIYAFESDFPNKTCLIMILNPKSKEGDSNNFSTDALYKFHLGVDKQHSSEIIYRIRLHEGLATIGLLEQSQDYLEIAGDVIGQTPLNTIISLPQDLRF